ncbi:glycosyltransferase family 39 protein [Halobacteriovorax sp. HLS]|uniref:ArnT family glycosyltransferase n=1 Tax=Halobacteriovorax sp. HLS TaxID=2234000 RepID=UPI000FD853DC|nr:glycosyltransferase family 39 protein [Halobacteriovorax sp. HLS]
MIEKIKENSIFWSLLFLSIVLLTIQLDGVTLRSVDGAVYSSIARELADKPFKEWVVLTWRGGEKFYENPHFMPMYLATFIRVLGITSYTVIIPIILLSVTSLVTVFKLGEILVSKRLGLFSMFALIATPQFIKEGRNPMLETALMCFTLLSIYFGIKCLKDKNIKLAFVSGLLCALAFLSKGPICLLAPGVLFGFYLTSHFSFSNSLNFSVTHKQFFKIVLLFVLGFILIMGVIDIWHFMITEESFWLNYYNIRLLYTINHPTAGQIESVGGDPLFYFKLILKKHIPWAYIGLAALMVAFLKTAKDYRPAIIVGSLMTFGYLLGFSLIVFKAPWYINVYFGGISLMGGVTLSYTFEKKMRKFNAPLVIISFSCVLLFLSSSFSFIFKKKERIVGTFLSQVETKFENRFKGKLISACYPMGMWRGNFIVHYFLGARLKDCNVNDEVKFVDLEQYKMSGDELLLYSNFPMGLVTKVKEK